MVKKFNEEISKVLMSNKSENGMDKAFSDLIQELGEKEKLQLFSDLNIKEIRHLSVLMTTGDSLIDNFTKNYIALKVSHRRRGRKELIDLSEAFGKAKAILGNSGLKNKLKELF